MKTKIALLVLMLTTALCSLAQAPVKVTGTVTDANGEPLIGVSVTVKGGTGGTATDLDGHYALTTATGSTLMYSYVGYD